MKLDPALMEWEKVIENDKGWTERLAIPGGWLYKHTQILLESIHNPGYPKEFQTRMPQQVAMCMVFVPETKA